MNHEVRALRNAPVTAQRQSGRLMETSRQRRAITGSNDSTMRAPHCAIHSPMAIAVLFVRPASRQWPRSQMRTVDRPTIVDIGGRTEGRPSIVHEKRAERPRTRGGVVRARYRARRMAIVRRHSLRHRRIVMTFNVASTPCRPVTTVAGMRRRCWIPPWTGSSTAQTPP